MKYTRAVIGVALTLAVAASCGKAPPQPPLTDMDFLNYVNMVRAHRGLDSLTYDQTLTDKLQHLLAKRDVPETRSIVFPLYYRKVPMKRWYTPLLRSRDYSEYENIARNATNAYNPKFKRAGIVRGCCLGKRTPYAVLYLE